MFIDSKDARSAVLTIGTFLLTMSFAACQQTTEPIPGLVPRLTVSTTIAVGRTVAPVAGQIIDYSYSEQTGGTTFETSDGSILRLNPDRTLTALRVGSATVRLLIQGAIDATNVDVIAGWPVTYVGGTDSLLVVAITDSAHFITTRPNGTQATLHKSGQEVPLSNCTPSAMNNRDEIACAEGLYRDGIVIDLFGASGLRGKPAGVTENGAVYGNLAAPDSVQRRGFVWQAGTVQVLPKTNPNLDPTNYTQVNGAGEGLAQSGDLYTAPFIVEPNGDASFLSPFGRYADAYDINDAGSVVGSSENMKNDGTAVVWLSHGAGTDIGVRGIVATGISERTEVVGIGLDGVFVWKAGRYTLLADAVAEKGWTFKSKVWPVISRNGTIAAQGVNADGRKGIVLVKLP